MCALFIDQPKDRAPRKKFVGPYLEECAAEALEGYVAVHNGLRLLGGTKNVVVENLKDLRGKVAIISGGGSGHEPFAAGFVGKGMLAGCAMGTVFSSPPPKEILPLIDALVAVGVSAILLLVINYTGSRLCFGIAMEKAKKCGIKNISMYILQDDRASIHSAGGRRGLVGSILLIKIAGALAERGASVEQITEVLDQATKRVGTIGVCLNPGSRPGGPFMFSLEPSEFELGLGIHGEAGVSKIRMAPVSRIIAFMVGHMTWGGNAMSMPIAAGDHILIMVNNLGATSKIEEYMVCRELVKKFERRMNVRVLRAYNDHLMTSLDMKGIQFAVFQLGKEEDEVRWWLKLFDMPTEAPAWPYSLLSKDNPDRFTPAEQAYSLSSFRTRPSQEAIAFYTLALSEEAALMFGKAILAAMDAVAQGEMDLNELDATSGDGDTGTALRNGVDAIRNPLKKNQIDVFHPALTLSVIADVCAASMGGISGALYSLFFMGAARSLKDYRAESEVRQTPPSLAVDQQRLILAWINAFAAGVENLRRYGGADAGDRTMLDALVPALRVMNKWDEYNGDIKKFLDDIAKAADDGAQNTANMKARAGRAAYLNVDKVVEPDPGAIAASLWIRAVCNVIKDAFP